MIKKICPILLVLVLALTMLSIPAFADEYIYVTGDILNIRSGPSTSYDVLGQARYGDSLVVLGREGSWHLIYYWGVKGYVSCDYTSCTKPEAKPAPAPAPTPSSAGEAVVAYAKNFVGVPYVYGGNTPDSGFDCSGFVKYVFSNFGVQMPRTSYSQMNVGTPITRDALVPGDLVVFRGGGHVGIYVGNNYYIHAPQSGRNVTVEEMNRELYCARRIVW